MRLRVRKRKGRNEEKKRRKERQEQNEEERSQWEKEESVIKWDFFLLKFKHWNLMGCWGGFDCSAELCKQEWRRDWRFPIYQPEKKGRLRSRLYGWKQIEVAENQSKTRLFSTCAVYCLSLEEQVPRAYIRCDYFIVNHYTNDYQWLYQWCHLMTFDLQKQRFLSFENNTGPIYGPTDRRTEGRTRPLMKMRCRI